MRKEEFKSFLMQNKKKVIIASSLMVVGLAVGGVAYASTPRGVEPVNKKVASTTEELKKTKVDKVDHLEEYVKGMKDWVVEEGTKKVDFMKGVEWDKSKVKSVTADSSKVQLNKEGKYDLVYHIVGVLDDGDEEVTVKKVVEVKVLSKEEAKKEADKGTVVTTDGNKVKKDSKGNTPVEKKVADNSPNVGGTTKKEENAINGGSGKTDNSTQEKPSAPSKEEKPSNPSKEEKPSTPSKGDEPSKPSGDNKPQDKPSKPTGGGGDDKPSHTHSWQEQTEVVNHPAETKVVNHPEESHIETVVIQDSQYIPNLKIRNVCHSCGADITGKVYEHSDWHWDNYGETISWGEQEYDAGGYWTDQVTEQRKVVDKEAWSETIVTKEAWSETIVTGHKCNGCGATK